MSLSGKTIKQGFVGITIVSAFILLALAMTELAGRASANGWGPLSGTDDLGRTVSDYGTVGQTDSNRYVGMFYFLWHGANDLNDYKVIHNNDETLAANPTAYSNPSSSVWPAPQHGAYWGKPLFGYYRTEDEWVMRRHMQLMADAGVDYLVIDTTNYQTYKSQADLLMRVIEDMQRQGMNPPLVSFMTHTNSTQTMDEIYNTFYSATAPYRHPSTWFYWKGKPLIIGNVPTSTVSSFFTFRYAQWPVEAQQPNNGWDWISFVNPPRVNYNNLGAKEQMAISPAQNSGSSAVFSYTAWYNMDNPASRSRTYHNGAEDNAVNAVNYGYNFQEQWNSVIAQDPETVLVTAWNEWTAGNWANAATDPLMFYDAADKRWSRDIEPMAGGFGDNYYMQLVDNIRKYKGIQAPATPSAATTITINSNFSQWTNVTPEYKDASDDTIPRFMAGTDNKTYANATGRNNIVSMKVARDATNVYFYVRTDGNLTSYTDSRWMTLFLNVDGNGTNGWKGYDYALNRVSPGSSSAATLERSTGGWSWTSQSSSIAYSVSGNEMMVAIPRSAMGSLADPLNIQFKWADNWQTDNDITAFYQYGDAAPYGRLNFIYRTGTLPAQVASPTPPTPPAKTTPSAGFYKIEDNSFSTEYSHNVNWLTAADAGASGGTYTYAYQLNPGGYFKAVVHGGFTGNSIRWLTTTNPDGTEAEVFIDGLSQGKANLYSPTIQKQAVVFQKYVPQGTHEIIVKWSQQKGNVYHDAFEYGVGNVTLAAPAGGENMAAKADASSSTFATGRYFPMNAAQATDGDQSTYWRGTAGANEYLYLDFGRDLAVDQVQLLQNAASSTISQYKILYWNAGSGSWSTAYTSAGNMPASQSINFSSVTTRKVALKVEAMSGGTGTPAIFEMKAYNTANPGSGPSGTPTNWEFTNDWSGWNSPGGMSGFGWQSGGTVGGAFNHPDPQLYSADNLNISLASKKAIRISLKNSTSSMIGQIYFTTTSSTSFSEAKSKTFPIVANSSGYVEYLIDMSTVAGWTGTLKQLRLDPQSGSSTGSYSLDYVRLLETASLRTWDFPSDAQGWTYGGMASFGPTPGGVVTGNINYTDPQIYSPDNLGIDISTSKIVRVALLNQTSGTSATIFFQTTADPTYTAAKSKQVTILANDGLYREYVFDMTGVTGWTGTLKQLRFDPQNGAGSGLISIDYIKLPPQ